MNSMRPINRKARRVEEAVIAVTGDVQALQKRGGEGKVYYPMGCTLNFTPGWEVDIFRRNGGSLPARRARSVRLLSGLRLAGAGSRPLE